MKPKRYYSKLEQNDYDLRWLQLMADIHDVTLLPEREEYLYPLMDRVVFEDFETALEGVILEFEAPPSDDENPTSH